MAYVFRATVATACPDHAARRPTRGAHCWRVAAILEHLSALEPRANISSKEPPHSRHGQLFCLDKLSFLAVLSESPDPVKIINDRSARKAALFATDQRPRARADQSPAPVHSRSSWTMSGRKSLMHYHDNRTSLSRSGGPYVARLWIILDSG